MIEPVRDDDLASARAEVEHLRRRLDEVGLLGRVAVAANEAEDLAAALTEGLSLLGRHAGCTAATVWLRDRGTGELGPSGQWFLGAGAAASLADAVDAAHPVGLGSLPGRVEASGAPVWLVGLDRRSHWLQGAADDRLGIASAFGVPVWGGGERCGVLAGFYAEERSVDAHLLELLEQVATQLGAVYRRGAAGSPGGHPPSTADGSTRWLVGASPDAGAAIAHRVRTPLIGVLTPLELLLAGERDPDRHELLVVALGAAKELHGLLEAALRGAPLPVDRDAGDEGQPLASMR